MADSLAFKAIEGIAVVVSGTRLWHISGFHARLLRKPCRV
jgi:hypothetical protein